MKLSGDMGGVRPETLRDRTSRIESRDGLGRAKQEPEPRAPMDGFTARLWGYAPHVAVDRLAPLNQNPKNRN